jgi:hypothetical protein
MELDNQPIILKIRAPRNAEPKLSIYMPLIRPERSQSMNPFIINRKNPRVKIVSGSVRTIRIGLTIAFNMPRNKAASRAYRKL